MIGKIIDGLKNLVSRNENQRGAAMPRRYASVTWNSGARRMGVGGERNKRIHVIEENSPKKAWFPYSEHLVNAMREVRSMPVWDETGGQENPEPDLLANYDPGRIGYDQTRFQR